MSKTKILLTGGSGLLGQEFISQLIPDQYYCPSSKELDITNYDSVFKYCEQKQDISHIINCAGNRDAEHLEGNEELSFKINTLGPKHLAMISKQMGVPLIHFSSDYVFDGLKNTPYTENDVPNPISIYGKTKLDGENYALSLSETCLCFRTSWIFSSFGKDFIKTMINLSKTKDEISVVNDQIGSPTYGRDIATIVLSILPQIKVDTRKIYNLANEGAASWYDVAHHISKLAKLPCLIKPISSNSYVLKAKRPSFSVLDKTLVRQDFNINIRHWHDALEECISLIRS